MSLKKRMFRSNMAILFLALLSLLAIVMFVLIAFEDSIERNVQTVDQAELDGGVMEIVSLVSQADPQDITVLQQRAETLGYQVTVIKDGKIQAGESGENMQELAARLEAGELQEDGTGIFYYHNATIVRRHDSETGISILAANFPEENWLVSSLEQAFQTLVTVLLVICIGAIAVLLFLSSFFTRRMSRIVMEPLEELVKGAERIQQGNLEEKIRYCGDEEFEYVCRVFNSMQDTILEDQRQRERYESARTDMVTGISHDLRTPLTSIQGYIKGVLDGVADTAEKQRRYLTIAYESAGDMNVLLQKLFDFSRMESGQMPFHMVEADLIEFTASYVARQEERQRDGQVEFTLRVEPERTPEILMDPDQIQRIFDNLLENSRKYSETCPVKIEICVSQTGDFVELEWKDNGPGVPEEKLGRIFDRFYRCDEARGRKGSGVMLYVAKCIMERHNGVIRAENDGGLKITLLFPKTGE